jgi:tripartite ATP-independent transporter DctP family solute receptor
MERLIGTIKGGGILALAFSLGLGFAFFPSFGWGAEKILMKYAHVGPPGNPFDLGAIEFAKKVAEKTKGRVEIKIFPAGQLGEDRDLAEGVQLGSIEIAVPSNAVMTRYVPRTMLFELPFLFRDDQHWEKVVDGPIGKEMAGYFKAKGFHVLAFVDGGWRGPYARRPIRNFEDIKGLKFRTMESPMHIAIYDALGARGVPMSSKETYSALQQGVVDGCDSPWIWYKQLKHYEIAKHLTTLPLFKLNNVHLMSEKIATGLSPEVLRAIEEAAYEAQLYQRKVQREMDTRLLEELKKEGVQVYTISGEEREKFVQAVSVVWKKYESEVGKDKIEAVLQTK